MTPTKADASRKAPGRTAHRTDRMSPRKPARTATGPPVDPRIRQRRAAVTRREGRRRLRIVLVLLLVVLALVGVWFLLHSRLFVARVVTVVGSVHTPTAEIVSVAGLSHDPPMIDVNPGATAARLERLPWVSVATVSRRWPDGVRITVVERTPVATVSTSAPPTSPTTTPAGTSPTTTPAGTSPTTTPATTTTAPLPWALVARSGRVLADTTSPPAGLVHLVGPSAPGPPGSDVAGAGPGLTVVATLPRAFSAQVTEVDVSAGGQVTLKLTTPVTIFLGTTAQLAQKYEDAASVLAGAKLVTGDVIDVSVPESPTVAQG
jgi:cell division protein FtsQ